MTQSSAAVLTDLSDAGLAAAIEGSPIEFWRACCNYQPEWDFHEDAEVTWFTTGISAAPWYNQVLLTRVAQEDAKQRIDETLASFRGPRLPMLWSVTPSTRPPNLGSLLEAQGLNSLGSMAGMAIDLEQLPDNPSSASLAIEEVRDSAMLESWARSYIDGFEMAESAGHVLHDLYDRIGFTEDVPFRHYVGLLDQKPVASATVFLGKRVASIWHVSTVRSARRLGIGSEMTLAPLRAARASGYRVGTLYASTMGLSVYKQLGFEQYSELTQYQWSPDR
jgi:ribosomal protein S18 acetylase RimI-like enzyme